VGAAAVAANGMAGRHDSVLSTSRGAEGLAEPDGPRADFSEMIGPRLAALALLLTACGGVAAVATPTPTCRPAPILAVPSAAASPV
jgi:hypothetical protein